MGRALGRGPGPTSSPSYKRTSYYPGRPLFDAGAANLAADAVFSGGEQATDVRLIAALAHGVDLRDGEALGEIVVTAADGQRYVLPLRAGDHVSEVVLGARRRPQRGPGTAWPKAPTLIPTAIRPGDPYQRHLFYSEHPLPTRVRVQTVELRYQNGVGVLRVFGLGLGDAVAGGVYQIGQYDRANLRLVHADPEVRIYENLAAYPRAFVVHQGVWPRRGSAACTA